MDRTALAAAIHAAASGDAASLDAIIKDAVSSGHATFAVDLFDGGSSRVLVVCKSTALDVTTTLRMTSVLEALHKSALAVVSPKRNDSEADKKAYGSFTSRMQRVRKALKPHLPADATQPRSRKRKGRGD